MKCGWACQIGLLTAVWLCAAQCTPARAQHSPARGKLASEKVWTVRELTALMYEPVDVRDYAKPMKLSAALAKLRDRLARGGRIPPITADVDSFKAENPDAPDLYETEVELPQYPRFLRVHQVLRTWAGKVPTQNGTFLIRPGRLEITAQWTASPAWLAQQKVFAEFRGRSLGDALENLYDQTGVSVIVDPRVAYKLRMSVTARFTNEVTLQTALVLLSDMAGLAVIPVDNAIYMTAPSNARQMLQQHSQALRRAHNFAPPYPRYQQPRGPQGPPGLGI